MNTEVWNRKNRIVVKAVARNARGHFLGQTNKTREVIIVNMDALASNIVSALKGM